MTRVTAHAATILLVDDEVAFTDSMARLLVNRGYRVTAVNSGDSALELLAERGFGVVVLDLEMPGLDGLATLREIKNAEHATEVLILTGHGGPDSALEAMRLGASDCLTKPCEVDDLVRKIEAAWERREGARTCAECAEHADCAEHAEHARRRWPPGTSRTS